MKRSFGPSTVAFPTPVFIVGSYDDKGEPNIMAVAWGGICCSDPPSVAISLRKSRYSFGNIMKRKAFTISVPQEEFLAESDYSGSVSGKDHDKFREMGLTPVRSELVDAPYVDEFPLIMECRVTGFDDIGIHTRITGEVVGVKIEENILDGERIDMETFRPFIYLPQTGSYRLLGEEIGKGYRAGEKFKK